MTPIPFVDLKAQYARIREDVHARIDGVLEHGRYIMGPEVAELEDRLAAFAGSGHAVGLSSGSDALLVALMAEEIGPGDAVFLPTFTFTATAEVVLLTGAAPVFVDVDESSFNIDIEDLGRRVGDVATAGRLRPRAVIPVDLFGLPADYEAIARIAEPRDMFVLADAAQSFGGSRGGRRVGRLAPVTATSFFPAKPLGCYGDGGALLTDDAARAARYRSIRAHGKGDGKYDIVRIGLNARLDTLQAAILLAKLGVFEEEIAAREKLARLYDSRLAGAVRTPARYQGTRSAWAQYTVQVEERDRVAVAMRERDVPTAVYYPMPMHRQPAYGAFAPADRGLPVSDRLSAAVLSLPMHPYMDEATAHRVCDALIAAVGGS